jgi:MoaA/NifB/PqqE/SkfB family radical SAM enzyme
METFTPDIRELYRLPFSKNDNPNGWIEVTTHCNLGCPDCYRGCDRPEIPQSHMPLEAVKENIEAMLHIRNCRIISISGGEPLLHPDIEEIIRFISAKGALPWLHTNGLALTEQRLISLKNAGLKGVIVRVDSLKDKVKSHTENELNEERLKFGLRVGNLDGIHLSFICVVSKDNLDEIPDIVQWAMKNNRLVDFLAFISLRQVKFSEDDVIDKSRWVTLEECCRVFRGRFTDMKYASYLGSVEGLNTIKWLQSIWISFDGEVLGYPGPRMVELFQGYHHWRFGKYAYKFGDGRSYLGFLQILLLSLFLKEMRKTAANYLNLILKNPVNLFRRATLQMMCFIIPPGENESRSDTCEGCPDAILYDGGLYPSCGLEEVKLKNKNN